MKSSNTTWWVIGAIIVLGLAWWLYAGKGSPLSYVDGTNATSTATSTPVEATSTGTTSGSTTGGSTNLGETYVNTPYGFSISYPKELTAQPFDVFGQLNQNDWRYAATTAKRGTPVISIPVIEFNRGNGVATGQPYPLFYTAQVRIGVSTDTAQCYAKDDGYSSQTITDVTIGGVAWKKFIFGDAAMMKYVNGSSYRTIHAGKCYAVEAIQNGSSYSDPTMKPGYTEAQLKAFFDKATLIATTFKFTK
jgi:hypothetical protein